MAPISVLLYMLDCIYLTASIDGGWTHWSAWTGCHDDCLRNWTRSCSNPSPAHGGFDCNGNATQEGFCHPDLGCPRGKTIHLYLYCVPAMHAVLGYAFIKD
jgi:hypothetical protein